MSGRIPPHNIDAEESVLLSVFIDTDNTDTFDALAPSDFYKTSHQKIFAAMAWLYQNKQPTDALAVKNRLQETGCLGEIGGAAYLASLMDNAPYPPDKSHYIKIITEKSIRRKMIIMANEISLMAHDQTATVDGSVAQITKALNEIDTAGDTRDGFVSMEDMAIPTIERYELLDKTGASGFKTGFGYVDKIIGGLQPGDLTIIAARPGMGKTAFATCIAKHNVKDGVPCGVFSLEMSKEQNVDRLVSGETRINLSQFRAGGFSASDWTDLIEQVDKIKTWPLYIDDTPGLHYQQLRRRARVMQRKHGVRLIVVDYIQLMSGDRGGNREVEVSSISRNLKLLAKELGVPVIALSQLNRSLESRDNKRPRLSDLRESGAIEQDADNILFLYRDEVYDTKSKDKGLCEVIVSKQRMGPVATARVAWVGPTAQFKNLETWERPAK
jgi:replicative DNA helicase